MAGCGEGSPFGDEDSVPDEIPGALLARDFPTADGFMWEYVSSDSEHVYVERINGTRNIGGSAARIRESDSGITVSQLGVFYGLPIRNSFFTKDIDSYTEHAFDLWLPEVGDTFFQRNFPKRILWSFPLYKGKEWIVSKSLDLPEISYIRKVVSDEEIVTVPAGTFGDVYCVEEQVFFAEFLPEEQLPPSKYWVVRDVGVIRYEYIDPVLNSTVTYELSRFEAGR